MSVENEYIQMGEEGIRNTAEETKNKISQSIIKVKKSDIFEILT